MVSAYENQPIKIGDTVKVIGKNTGLDNCHCTVLFVDNLSAIATIRVKRWGTQKKLHVSKLELTDRPITQLQLF